MFTSTVTHMNGQSRSQRDGKSSDFKGSFWKHKHYFSLVEVKGKIVYVTCNLCPGGKGLSRFKVSLFVT